MAALADTYAYSPVPRRERRHYRSDGQRIYQIDARSQTVILLTSSKGDPSSRQWIDGVFKNTIRKDPLLRFLLHARGTDFHGLDSGAEPHVDGANYFRYESNPGVEFEMDAEDGTKQLIGGGAIALEGDVKDFKFEFRLVPVTDNRRNTFEPPALTPVGAASNAFEFYQSLLREAAERVAG